MTSTTAGPELPEVPITVYGGPTVLIEYAGLRILTDPTFDDPGEYPTPVPGFSLVKTEPSPVSADQVEPVDVVLLSHDEHDDNLDRSGRQLVARAPLTLTTPSGAERLGGTAEGLAPWQERRVPAPGGTVVTVTAVPALHGPEGSDAVSGDVTGFLLSAPGHPTVYVSGDNASLDLVREIADRYAPVDTAVLFLGGVRHAPFFDGALVTLDNALAVEATRILGARRVVPAHVEGWAHFRGTRDDLVATFTAASLRDRLHVV